MKGIIVEIMGNNDCTNGGVTSGKTEAILVCKDGWIDIEKDNPDNLPVLTITRNRPGRLIAVPINVPGSSHFMFGGHFIYSSDARFIEFSSQPIHIHDRIETPEKTKLYSM